MGRWFASFCFGLLALMAALNSGLPFWRDYPIGDAFDFGLTTALAVYALIGAVRGTVIVNNMPAPKQGQVPPHSDNKESDRG